MQWKLLWVLLIGLLIAACSPTTLQGEVVTADMADGTMTMLVNPEALVRSETDATAAPLELNLEFRNNTEQDVTLNLVAEDFVLLTSDGIELTPTSISPELLNATIPASASITGEAEFGVLNPISTFTLQVTGFEDVTIDANVPMG